MHLIFTTKCTQTNILWFPRHKSWTKTHFRTVRLTVKSCKSATYPSGRSCCSSTHSVLQSTTTHKQLCNIPPLSNAINGFPVHFSILLFASKMFIHFCHLIIGNKTVIFQWCPFAGLLSFDHKKQVLWPSVHNNCPHLTPKVINIT